MARTIYTERAQQVVAAKSKGNNFSELDEVAPGKIVIVDGQMMLVSSAGNVPINVTDWVMDDPVVGFPTVQTDAYFSARFDLKPVP